MKIQDQHSLLIGACLIGSLVSHSVQAYNSYPPGYFQPTYQNNFPPSYSWQERRNWIPPNRYNQEGSNFPAGRIGHFYNFSRSPWDNPYNIGMNRMGPPPGWGQPFYSNGYDAYPGSYNPYLWGNPWNGSPWAYSFGGPDWDMSPYGRSMPPFGYPPSYYPTNFSPMNSNSPNSCR